MCARATGKAAAQGEPDGTTGQESCHPSEVTPVAEPHVMVTVYISRGQPALGAGGLVILLNQDQGFRLGCVGGQAGNQFCFNFARRGILTGMPDDHPSVSLAHATLCPGGKSVVGFVNHVVVVVFQTA